MFDEWYLSLTSTQRLERFRASELQIQRERAQKLLAQKSLKASSQRTHKPFPVNCNINLSGRHAKCISSNHCVKPVVKKNFIQRKAYVAPRKVLPSLPVARPVLAPRPVPVPPIKTQKAMVQVIKPVASVAAVAPSKPKPPLAPAKEFQSSAPSAPATALTTAVESSTLNTKEVESHESAIRRLLRVFLTVCRFSLNAYEQLLH